MLTEVALTIFLYMNLFFLIALWKKNFAVVDIGWGLGFVVVALLSYLRSPLQIKNALVLLVVLLWGLRLAIYLLSRNAGKAEDFRYAQLRKEWDPRANLQAYFKVFLLQGFLMFVISLPISVGMRQADQGLHWYNWLGLLIFAAGFSLEVWADHYLAWFKAKPENKGKICTTGPWRLCRFPNYFGEVTLWYGVWLLTLSPGTWWTIIGPFAINLFILKVSGIPLLEEKYRLRPEYQEYSQKVSRFIPFL